MLVHVLFSVAFSSGCNYSQSIEQSKTIRNAITSFDYILRKYSNVKVFISSIQTLHAMSIFSYNRNNLSNSALLHFVERFCLRDPWVLQSYNELEHFHFLRNILSVIYQTPNCHCE